MISAILHSLIIAVTATTVGFFLILPLSYLGAFKNYRFKWLVETILLLPLVLPPTIVGLYLLLLFGKYGWLGGLSSVIFSLTGAIIASTVVILPLLYQGMKGALASVPKSIGNVAATLSASPLEILFRIILPNCWQVMTASILLAFCRALGEFGASLMVAGYIEGKTNTIANSIYFAVQNGDQQQALILSGLNIAFGLILLLVIYFLTQKRSLR